ncbi:hypothetical protein OQA88_11765 [Cercophora sp. LCS_1]
MDAPATHVLPVRDLIGDANLLDDPGFQAFSDCQVKCGDKVWYLHKNIVCVRSKFFRVALMGDFEESKTGIIELNEFKAEDLDIVIRFIYTKNVAHIPDPTARSTFTKFLEFHELCLHIWAIGDYLNLGEMCRQVTCRMFNMNHLIRDRSKEVGAVEFLDDKVWVNKLVEVAKLAYIDLPSVDAQATPRYDVGPQVPIRELVVSSPALFKDDYGLFDRLHVVPGFLVDTIKALHDERKKGWPRVLDADGDVLLAPIGSGRHRRVGDV